jgi:transposase
MIPFFFISPILIMKKTDATRLRKKVQELAKQGMPLARIARELHVSRPFVHKWKDVLDTKLDARGWKKGRKRKYTDTQENIVVQKRQKNEEGFFSDQN